MHAPKDRVESDTSNVYSISLYESTITTRDEPGFSELKLVLGVIGLPVTARDRMMSNCMVRKRNIRQGTTTY